MTEPIQCTDDEAVRRYLAWLHVEFRRVAFHVGAITSGTDVETGEVQEATQIPVDRFVNIAAREELTADHAKAVLRAAGVSLEAEDRWRA
jgi:hypothetical protein